jgi:hypothetical protein
MQFLRWVFGGSEDDSADLDRSLSSAPRRLSPLRETVREKERILVVSIRTPPTCESVALRLGREGKFTLTEERIVDRSVMWGQKITLGPLERGSTVVATLSDGNLVEIPFLGGADSKEHLATHGEAAYPVSGATRRQCLVRWEAVPIPITPRLREVTCNRRNFYKFITSFILPLLYFCMCLYCMYKLGLFGASTVDALGPTPSEFSFLVLPITLLIGMFIAVKAFYSGVRLRLKGCAARISVWREGNKDKLVSTWIESLIWKIDFVDISSVEEAKDSVISEEPEVFESPAPTEFEGRSEQDWPTEIHRQDSVTIHGSLARQKSHTIEMQRVEGPALEETKVSSYKPEELDVKSRPLPGTEMPDLKRQESKLTVDQRPESKAHLVEQDAKLSKEPELPTDSFSPIPPEGVSFAEYSKQTHTVCWGTWTTPDPSYFQVRGKTYLDDRVKVPSEPWLLDLVYADLLAANEKYTHVSLRPDSFLQIAIRKGIHSRTSPPMFVVNFLMPGYHMVLNLIRNAEVGGEAGALFDRFFNEASSE